MICCLEYRILTGDYRQVQKAVQALLDLPRSIAKGQWKLLGAPSRLGKERNTKTHQIYATVMQAVVREG